jgi:hypothetical protein
LYLISIVYQHSHNIPLINVCGDYHRVHVRERSKLDVSFSEGYLDMRPLGSYYGALDRYMIHLAVMLSFLSLVFEV